MCGIAGIVDHGAGLGRERLRDMAIAMRDTMSHRGPDDAGVWVDPSGTCALAHRRLSIIDLSSRARQPIANEDGSVHASFNGEIYNFRELRASLVARGHSFQSESDSEVLPHLFESMDPAHLHDLDGMFGLSVWHSGFRQLLLARDPFGKKPLYYSQGPGWFAFASELQALTTIPGIDATVDLDAVTLYLLLQYIPHPWTIFKGIKKLPPGSFILSDYKKESRVDPIVTSYFEFEAEEPGAEIQSPAGNVEHLKNLIRQAVHKRLVSDVPLGAFLSGGVDSSLVVAMMRKELGVPVKTFSIGFDDMEGSEHLFAREVAQCLGTEHHEQILNPDVVSQVPQIASRLDEPNGDSSCLPTLLLSLYTHQFVSVALSGDGGDELFGGYGRYQEAQAEVDSWAFRLRQSFVKKRRFADADAYLSPRFLTFLPEQVEGFIGGLSPVIQQTVKEWERRLNNSRQPFLHRMRNLDVSLYLPGAVLPKVDRMSMQASLEIRCPLLDKEVGRFSMGLSKKDLWGSQSTTKLLLKQLASQYLPERLMYRKKMGFGLPSSIWSKKALLGLVNDSILAPSGQLANYMDQSNLKEFFGRQNQSGLFSVYQVWPLLILELWLRNSKEGGTS